MHARSFDEVPMSMMKLNQTLILRCNLVFCVKSTLFFTRVFLAEASEHDSNAVTSSHVSRRSGTWGNIICSVVGWF